MKSINTRKLNTLNNVDTCAILKKLLDLRLLFLSNSLVDKWMIGV
jgi:hypothetical protein